MSPLSPSRSELRWRSLPSDRRILFFNRSAFYFKLECNYIFSLTHHHGQKLLQIGTPSWYLVPADLTVGAICLRCS
ncbi:hypothetical protein K7X08_022758 [Anisodus acutangulus]|uniref:Uncharacterized protein n=1 Tax=Anisodus acutangulus TaxID=402998 RepID=A0A9Q1MD07_9SOLA|nr:hypothetical protein K7X08_022758 [Anisodus acutangulus]